MFEKSGKNYLVLENIYLFLWGLLFQNADLLFE